VRNFNDTLTVLFLAIAFGFGATAIAQQSGGMLNVDLDSKTLNVQAKAEELFERGDYRRAHIIYRNDLAPIGDKYAQYMLGFMILRGLGVEQDPVLASAWYRLAAERGEPEEFVAIRDEVLGSLDFADRGRADDVYLDLRREYSDIAISMREASEEFESLSQVSTGSHLGVTSSAITIVEPRTGVAQSADVLIIRTQHRMQRHLDRITKTLGIDRIDAETVTSGQLADLEEQVQEYVARINAG
jgi:hypothetical protein